LLKGLWKLTWLEIKIFLREPLGAIGTLVFPILIFIVLGKVGGGRISAPDRNAPSVVGPDLPIFASILIALSAVLSLATIVAIYREGGILKRLRATPMRPHTILTAHVVVKLLFALATLLALIAAGKRVFPAQLNAPMVSFSLAVLLSTLSILSLGFVLASLIPTARFVQPVGALLFYPMVALSGLFFPIEALPPTLRLAARMLPLTYAVSLMRGTWRAESWFAHGTDVAALVVVIAVSAAVSARYFRWE
jgi:ABC-2 type transport system permease protein